MQAGALLLVDVGWFLRARISLAVVCATAIPLRRVKLSQLRRALAGPQEFPESIGALGRS